MLFLLTKTLIARNSFSYIFEQKMKIKKRKKEESLLCSIKTMLMILVTSVSDLN